MQILRKCWSEQARLRPFHSSLNITEDGLLLGAGTCLAPMIQDHFGVRALDLDGREEHIVGLLSLAYQKPVSVAALKCIKRASAQWAKGAKALAHLELAYAGLPKFESKDEAYQLFCADGLIGAGVSARWLMRSVGLDTRELDLLKYAYDPGQPRVPAGSGIESGRWTSGGSKTNAPATPGRSGEVMSDANPDPIWPGQQYAQNFRQFPWGKLPVVGGRGGGGGAGPGNGSGDAEVAKTIEIPAGRFGEAAEHMRDAIKSGKPDVLTIDRAGTEANRAAATGAMDKVPGMHLDEYPPAMFLEGGAGASVRAISPKDNMSMGAHIGNCCRGLPNGARVKIEIGK
ncbi:NucA/NucB deoxyribonuclease domain-containing protein [Methyloferula stellata]|uniref:NucA/NucB deoxyribonuclease domain-containing protein n=1 Tax=Methyloferula stellata TaxID=876270 RepID=UPI0003642791|nr:NucA/NucB deoxyribonuclease domain-containing protein [Methyloferula stellata]